MEELSLLRRARSLPALVALVLAQASRASAQMPVFAPEPEPAAPAAPAPETAPSPVPPPVAAEPAPAAAAPLPPPPAAPPPGTLAPAKTDHLEAQASESDEVDEGELDDAESEPRRNWYGWQTLVADGGSLVLIIAGASLQDSTSNSGSDELITAGLLGYTFAPGIMHFAHGNTGRGFGSFGLRIGMPLAGAFLGAAAASGCDGFLCEAGGAGIGLLLGMGGAIAIDAAVFAYEDREPRDREARLVPLVAVGPRATWLGLAGTL